MSEKRKTTGLELSKQLAEAGAKQDASLAWGDVVWFGGRDGWQLFRADQDVSFRGEDISYASFDCHELLEGLPKSAVVEKEMCGLYRAWFRHIPGPATDQCDTPAEALGQLKLWYLQNGHCEKAGGGS